MRVFCVCKCDHDRIPVLIGLDKMSMLCREGRNVIKGLQDRERGFTDLTIDWASYK